MTKNILIVAGEPSGDTLGAPLAEGIHNIDSDIQLWGCGGDGMRESRVNLHTHIRDLSVMGFTEVVARIPAMLKKIDNIAKLAVQRKTSGAILIDYPGFNLRLAKKLTQNGIKVVYYVSPQIWAWKPGRIDKIRQCVDHMMVILPFEKEIYEKAKIPVTFVGHPFIDLIKPSLNRRDFRKKYNLEEPILLLLPGSRTQEIESLLRPMLSASKMLSLEIPHLQTIIAKAANSNSELFTIAQNIPNTRIIENDTTNAMFASTAAICCSGSATLQCSIASLPHVIAYRASKLSAFIYKQFIQTDFVGLTNHIAGKELAPELLQEKATPKNFAEAVKNWLIDSSSRQKKSRELNEIVKLLGQPGSSKRAAKKSIEIIFDR